MWFPKKRFHPYTGTASLGLTGVSAPLPVPRTDEMDRFQRIGLFIFLVAMGAIFSVLSPYFLTLENVRNILIQSSVLLIASMGMTLVIATAGIDLSMGSVLALTGIVAALVMKAGLGVAAGVAIALLAGAVLGTVNGWGVTRLAVPPFIITLGTMGIYRALGLIITEARPIYGLPLGFRAIGTGKWGPFPLCVLIALAVVGLVWFIITQTRFGTNLRAVGDNDEGAFRMGVPVARVRTGVYALAGISAAAAGLVVTARLNTAEAIAGMGLEMEAIAAVVMGGTSFEGGEASITGTVLGALIIGTIQNGLTMANVPSYYQQLVIGLIFVLAVLADQARRRVTHNWRTI